MLHARTAASTSGQTEACAARYAAACSGRSRTTCATRRPGRATGDAAGSAARGDVGLVGLAAAAVGLDHMV